MKPSNLREGREGYGRVTGGFLLQLSSVTLLLSIIYNLNGRDGREKRIITHMRELGLNQCKNLKGYRNRVKHCKNPPRPPRDWRKPALGAVKTHGRVDKKPSRTLP